MAPTLLSASAAMGDTSPAGEFAFPVESCRGVPGVLLEPSAPPATQAITCSVEDAPCAAGHCQVAIPAQTVLFAIHASMAMS